VTARIEAIFRRHRETGETALMPFITGGFPTLEDTRAAIPALAEAGASIIELGIPFSDPIADGPVIAASMHEALLGGATPERVLDVVRSVRADTDVGIVAMVSHSIVARIGGEAFVERCAAAGVDGLIVPDIDTGDAADLRRHTDAAGMSFTLLVAPSTPPERVGEIVGLCRGFVYVLARVGVTGERDAAPEVAGRVATIRALTDLPLAVGFGISTADHVRAVTECADGAIVGSALVRRMSEAKDAVVAARTFVASLAEGRAVRTGG
jgi:tryptophan synthase alpha chain